MKDRKPKYPGRVLITPENGDAPFYAVMTRADEPLENGDAINKQNLLQDSTAEAIGLDPEENPVVDDALSKLNDNYRHRYKVGDIITTVRTDLGEKWALCNGDTIYRDTGTNAELYALMHPGVDGRSITSPWGEKTGYDATGANGWWVTLFSAYSDGSGHYVAAGMFNPLTGETKLIYEPDLNGVQGELSLVGIAWDGARYVACYIYYVYSSDTGDKGFRFYTSTDLETWTLAAEHTPTYNPGMAEEYGPLKFLWDGAAYRVACQYEGYQAHYVHTYDSDFNYLGATDADYSDIYAADGLFVIGGSGTRYQFVSLFEPGSVEPLHNRSQVGDSAYISLIFERYYEDNYVAIPLGSMSQDTLRFYNKGTNSFTAISIADICSSAPYLCRVHIDIDSGELVFVLRPSGDLIGTTGAYLYLARISLTADMTNAANYTVSVYEPYTQDSVTTLNNLIRDENGELTYIGARAFRTMTLAGPHPRRLPEITHDECYTYIKIEEGE